MLEKISKNDLVTLFFIAGMSLLLALISTSPLVQNMGGDRDLFRYVGLLISKGYVPYVDVFDNKPPLIYFAGYGGNWWLVWLIETISISISALFFYLFAKHHNWVGALSCSLLYIMWLNFPGINGGGGLTYQLSASLAMITACCSLYEKPPYFMLGMLCAAIIFTQVNDILGVIPLVTYSLIHTATDETKKLLSFLKNALRIFLGFLLISAIIFSYFIYHHALTNFLFTAILFNFKYYIPSVHRTLAQQLSQFITNANRANILALFLFLIPANLLFLRFKKQDALLRNLSLLFLTVLIFNAFDFSLSGRFMPPYFLNTTVYFMFYLIIFANNLNSIWPKYTKKLLAVFTIIIAAMLLHSLRHGSSRFIDALKGPNAPVPYFESYLAPYKQMLSDVKGQDGQIYVYRSYLFPIALYSELKIKAPSMYVYSVGPYRGPDMFKDYVLDPINQYRTKYLLDYSISDLVPANPVPAKQTAQWQAMLMEHYQKTKPLYCPDNNGQLDYSKPCGWLYVRKD